MTLTHIDQGLRGKRIFVVEDEAAVSMLIEDMLDEIGSVVACTASRLPEALEKAQAMSYDAALLDVNLDGARSFDLARKLAAAHKPFVFVTGYGNGIVPEDLAGAPVLQKPFTLVEMEKAIMAALAGVMGCVQPGAKESPAVIHNRA